MYDLLLSPSTPPVLRCAVLPGACQSPTGFALISSSVFRGPRARLRVCLRCVSCLGMAERVGWSRAQDRTSWHLRWSAKGCPKAQKNVGLILAFGPPRVLGSSPGTRAGSVLTGRGCGGRTRLPANSAERLGNGLGFALCLLLSPRVRSWAGLRGVLRTEDAQSLCLQDSC